MQNSKYITSDFGKLHVHAVRRWKSCNRNPTTRSSSWNFTIIFPHQSCHCRLKKGGFWNAGLSDQSQMSLSDPTSRNQGGTLSCVAIINNSDCQIQSTKSCCSTVHSSKHKSYHPGHPGRQSSTIPIVNFNQQNHSQSSSNQHIGNHHHHPTRRNINYIRSHPNHQQINTNCSHHTSGYLWMSSNRNGLRELNLKRWE